MVFLNRRSWLVLGGDERLRWAARGLRDLGSAVTDCPDALPAAGAWDALLLPLPLLTDGSVTGTAASLEDVLALLPADAPCYGGRVPEAWTPRIRDYSRMEHFALENAVPTAEGAIELLLRNLDCTLNGAKVLVIGFGRIGRALAPRLRDLGASVTVSARKQGDWDAIRALGLTPDETGRYALGLRYDAIVNTVPAPVLDASAVARTDPGCYLLDLASAPGGLDFAVCGALGRRWEHALGLPGRTAPRTAGLIIRDVVLDDLSGSERMLSWNPSPWALPCAAPSVPMNGSSPPLRT